MPRMSVEVHPSALPFCCTASMQVAKSPRNASAACMSAMPLSRTAMPTTCARGRGRARLLQQVGQDESVLEDEVNPTKTIYRL